MGDGVLIGPNAIPIIIAVAVCGALGYWLSRSGQPRRTPSTLAMLWQALTWRLTPALRSWADASREKAVRHYAYDMSSVSEWEEDENDDVDVRSVGSERTANDGSEAFLTGENHGTEAFGSEPLDGFVLGAEELLSVQKMNHYLLTAAQRGQPPSKSGAILAGFGLKRGGGPRYARAALIYDTLFGQPEPAIVTPLAGRRTRAKFLSDLN